MKKTYTIANRLMSSRETAEFLGVKLATIQAWRKRNIGPPPVYITGSKHPRYWLHDVLDHVRGKVSEANGE